MRRDTTFAVGLCRESLIAVEAVAGAAGTAGFVGCVGVRVDRLSNTFALDVVVVAGRRPASLHRVLS
ncbi:hypothetical protein AAKU61_004669 [Undibacterium sp. GrIS 1.2]|uniref:hypothetical protein n=1 Tax=Undibacterium sp. GrIS 1.2 TaxID=3143933 RepID=UPI00339463A1